MSIEQSEAIILRIHPFSETSCVVSLFTRDFGKQGVLAKGAWRPRSPFEGALDLLSICRVVFIPKTGDALGLLTEAKLEHRFQMGRSDLLRLYCGYYVAEMLERLTEKNDPHPELYDLARTTIGALCDLRQEPRALVLRWEMQFLRLIGHMPIFDRCAQCGLALPSGVSWPFAPLCGGLVCPTCASAARPCISMPIVARQELERFSQANWSLIDTTTVIPNHRAVMRGALDRYLSSLLERRFNLTYYLQELGH